MAPNKKTKNSNKFASKESGKTDRQVLNDSIRIILNGRSKEQMKAQSSEGWKSLKELMLRRLEVIEGDNVGGIDEMINQYLEMLADLDMTLAFVDLLEKDLKDLDDNDDSNGGIGAAV